MQIQILGAVALAHGDRRIGVAARQVRTLLALLALSPGTPVPFDRLVEELWAGKVMGNARNALQANVVRLRKLLEGLADRPGDELVRTLGSGYVLDVDADSIDAYRFRDLADLGSSCVTRRPAEAIDLLERALRLWRGPALFDVGDGLRFRIEAARLDERRLSAREDLIAAKLANGEDRGVVSELKQLAAEYPERERFSEQLMVALYRNGRQTEALDVFHHTRRRLAAELGLEPGHALRELYQAILVHDQVLL
ncbi:AfsR/SARP family transcriptional regulator [Umezawaea sp.]|uniref:AfsR/SARP family transcriptional regulator n=1 Tax=Umezawaea sp. TaxID=1955258 RepID=UPI002ED45B7A